MAGQGNIAQNSAEHRLGKAESLSRKREGFWDFAKTVKNSL